MVCPLVVQLVLTKAGPIAASVRPSICALLAFFKFIFTLPETQSTSSCLSCVERKTVWYASRTTVEIRGVLDRGGHDNAFACPSIEPTSRGTLV